MIREASPEIEKLINLFVSTRFNPQTEHPPYQKNLDELTYSYLMKNYLQKSVLPYPYRKASSCCANSSSGKRTTPRRSSSSSS
jgi:hypothetical protein